MTTAASEKSGINWDQYLWAVTNENGQKEVINQLTQEKLRGKAVWGCGTTFVLNIAAACDGIENIAVFDIGERVRAFWEAAPKIILSLDPEKLEESQARFISWIKTECPEDAPLLEAEISDGVSFLSSKEKLQKICRVFHGTDKFSFTKVDFSNPREFLTFAMAQQKKALPHVVYISDIPQCLSAASPLRLAGMKLCQRWENFQRSIGFIPKDAIIIDSQGISEDAGIRDAVQRIHPKERTRLTASVQDVFEKVLLDDDYHAVTYCLQKGVDTTKLVDGKLTFLSDVAGYGHVNSVMALLDNKADVDTRDPDGTTPLMRAALGNRPEVIELLVSRKANVNATGEQNMTALHKAALKGHHNAARALLEFGGANRSIKDVARYTPLTLTRCSKMPVYAKRGTPDYDALQTLLDKGCKRKEPRDFKAPDRTDKKEDGKRA